MILLNLVFHDILLYYRDTAGQERYHSLAPMYYRGAQAAIVVYDITNTDTFERAKTWVKELQRQVQIITSYGDPFILKTDPYPCLLRILFCFDFYNTYVVRMKNI